MKNTLVLFCILTFEIFIQVSSRSVISKVLQVGNKRVKVSDKLTENDILIPKGSKHRLSFARAALWPSGIVPYTIDNAIRSDTGRYNMLIAAINEYHTRTCIKWKPKKSYDTNYVMFVDGGAMICSSYVGMIGGGQQILYGQGCERAVGVIMHEMAHALSFMHEQMRPDRDTYVTVLKDKIQSSRISMFDKLAQSDSILNCLAYDYSSMMHYGPTSFSVDGSITINTTDPLAQSRIGQRDGFSECDLEKINRRYNCTLLLNRNPACYSNDATCAGTTQLCTNEPSAYCPTAYTSPKNCTDVPGYNMFYCRSSCNNCDRSYCQDTTNPNLVDCRRVKCDSNNGYYYCPKSCGHC